ncbi:MAG: FkbM family methyltransferase [Ginsengibacter sp.]
MAEFLKNIIKKGLDSIGYKLSSVEFNKRHEIERAHLLNATLKRLIFSLSCSNPGKDKDEVFKFFDYSTPNLSRSQSQIFQDLFVLYLLKDKKNGFFIEFGATDGISLSNTLLLETEYNWKGILAEPGKIWEAGLRQNRNCIIDTRCVWSSSGQTLLFDETDTAELSTLNVYADGDFFSEQRKLCKSYNVETLSLNDLLSYYNAPLTIDYLSIDTEGSEFEILNAFDFSKYNISIITVEHNFSSKRNDIFNLLALNGYTRVFESISMFDDWYVKEPLAAGILSN